MRSVTARKFDGLRDYQAADVRKILRAFREGQRRVLYVLPTAGGKTVVGVRVIQQEVRAGSRVLVMAHRKELIDQVRAQLVADGIDEDEIGLVLPGEDAHPDRPVQVASVQTLTRRTKPPADLVVVDEAHHATANSYESILSWYRDAQWLGLTATPSRLDGKPLGDIFATMVEGAKPSILVEKGWLMKPRVFTKKHGRLVDLTKIRVIGGDWDTKQLAVRVNRKELNGDIVQHWLDLAANRRTVAFAVNRKHARRICDAFLARGFAAEVCDGKTSPKERASILAPGGRLDRGVTRVVVTCQLVTEGWDLPSVKCVILARPTKSTTLYLQMAGRALRPWEEKRGRMKGLPMPPLILDHAGNALAHHLPHHDRAWSLTEKLKPGGGAPPTRRCPECGAIVCASICEECGADVPAPERALPKVKDAKLVEVEKVSEEERAAVLVRVRKVATERGVGEDWVRKMAAAILGEAA